MAGIFTKFFGKDLTSQPITEKELPGLNVTTTKSFTGKIAGLENQDLIGANKKIDWSKANINSTVNYQSTRPYQINSQDSIVNGFVNKVQNNQMLYLLSTWHKQQDMSKWEYEGFEEFDWNILENNSFMYGSYAVLKLPEGEIGLFSYMPKTYDINGLPKTIQLVKPNDDTILPNINWDKTYEVNKDIVIFQPNYDGLWAMPWTFGKLFKYWTLYDSILEGFQELNNNFRLTRNRLGIPIDNQDDITYLNYVHEALLNGDPAIAIMKDSVLYERLQGNGKGNNNLWIFDDKSQEIMSTIQFYLDTLKGFNGLDTNASPNKKERLNVVETQSNNTANVSQLKSEYYLRKQFAKNFNKVNGTNLEIKCIMLEDIENRETNEQYNEETKEESNV